jgi:hypothetical protein
MPPVPSIYRAMAQPPSQIQGNAQQSVPRIARINLI